MKIFYNPFFIFGCNMSFIHILEFLYIVVNFSFYNYSALVIIRYHKNSLVKNLNVISISFCSMI